MNLFLTLAYLFLIGSVIGWIIELLFRNITAGNKRWINPGFCTGPYLPLYGFGLCALYLLAGFEKYSFTGNEILNKILLFIIMAVCMTAIEYIAGIFCLKVLKVRLWDYSDNKGNIRGIICPLFSFYWAVFSAVYYFFIHPYIINALEWLSQNLAFSFFIGMFFGVFAVDVTKSAQIIGKMRTFAKEHSLILKYEEIKFYIVQTRHKTFKKYRFFTQFYSEIPLLQNLENMTKNIKKRKGDKR